MSASRLPTMRRAPALISLKACIRDQNFRFVSVQVEERQVLVHTQSEQEMSSTTAELPGWHLDHLNYPTFRMTLLVKIMGRLTIRQFAEHGDLNYAEWRVLGRLAEMPQGATVGQIADMAWVDRAEVSRAAGALEARGYVSRRENPLDRRAPLLSIAEPGRASYMAALEPRRVFHEALLEDLSPQERAQFDQILLKVGGKLATMLENES